jgi:phosphoenolpyruvate carboxylase
MAQRREPHSDDRDLGQDTARPLRRDVRRLGELLGTVLVEQCGPGLLAAVERIRLLARGAREQGTVADLDRAVTDLDAEQQARVLRAFALYFQLANIAEQHHRVRRRRAEARHGPLRESLDQAYEQLEGVDGDERRERTRKTAVTLVLTAHPTEATRRTVLLAHVRIADALAQLDDPAATPAERAGVEERLAEEITLLWQTDEVRHDRLRITDEIRNGLWFFEHSLFDAAADLVRD